MTDITAGLQGGPERQSGYEDTQNTLKQRQWQELPPDGGGIWVHDAHRLAEGLRCGA